MCDVGASVRSRARRPFGGLRGLGGSLDDRRSSLSHRRMTNVRGGLALLCGAAIGWGMAASACSENAAQDLDARDADVGTGAGADASDGHDASGPRDASDPDAADRDASEGPDVDGAVDDAGDGGSDACVTETSCVLSALRTTSSCADADVSQACDKGCTAAACNTSCDAPAVVVDQSVASDFTSIAPWQSFEVGATGVLTELAMRPNVYSATDEPSNLTLSIYVGEGVGGTRIHQQAYTLASAGGSPFHAFELTPTVPLQAGQTYTWELLGAKGIYYGTGDPYAEGRASAAEVDMVFKASFAACH